MKTLVPAGIVTSLSEKVYSFVDFLVKRAPGGYFLKVSKITIKKNIEIILR